MSDELIEVGRPTRNARWAENVVDAGSKLLTEDQMLYRHLLPRFVVKTNHGLSGKYMAQTDRTDLAIGATLWGGLSMYDRQDMRKSVTTSIRFQ